MSEAQDPKLIIDEDWKSQVEREKEEIREKQHTPGDEPQAEIAPEPDDATPSPTGSADEDMSPPPDATLDVLLSNLATQALVAMGQLSIPGQEPFPVRLDFAKHYIDMIDLVEVKTAGNRTDDESKHFADALHQLRMMYVTVVSEQKTK